MDKGLPGLLRRVMVSTVIAMSEEGEIDESRAVLWIESHAVQISQEGNALSIKIVKAEEKEDADGS